MDRRKFLKTASLVTGGSLLSRFALAFENDVKRNPEYSRVPDSKLEKLGILFKDVLKPISGTNKTLNVPMRARAARQYLEHIYVYYETVNHIYVYSLDGAKIKEIPIKHEYDDIHDFSINDNKNIFIVDYGKHCIIQLNENGEFLNKVGHFGDKKEELNGPRSITIDKNSNIHVVNSFSNSVKVYSIEGEFLKEYGKEDERIKILDKIDGKDNIRISYIKTNSRTPNLISDSVFNIDSYGEI